jgi:hypothetical protein
MAVMYSSIINKDNAKITFTGFYSRAWKGRLLLASCLPFLICQEKEQLNRTYLKTCQF